MRSAGEPRRPASAAVEEPATGAIDDRTARARIRDAAIRQFAADGVPATSVRAIAAEAGVSPALVIHHFGSKDDLRVACDQYVASFVRERKHRAVEAGAGLDPLAALREEAGTPVLRYLARTIVDGSPHIAELIDTMVDDAVGYLEAGIESGLMKPSRDLRGRAAILTVWSLGALALHEHVERLTGANLENPSEAIGYALPALEIVGEGVLTHEAYQRFISLFEAHESAGSDGKETGS